MSRIVYVNGRYEPYATAGVHVEDRGFQLADGVYEVCEIFDGKLVDETRHLDRLQRSLGELQMTLPMTINALKQVMRETIRRNRVKNGLFYLQITRGQAHRDFIFPPPDTPPTTVCLARSISREKGDALAERGIAVITMSDNRWERVDIKSILLLPSALARQKAKEQGALEAWLVDNEGFVTEGAASNAWIVDQNNRLRTRHAEYGILRGVTRSVVLELAGKLGLDVVEEAFTVEEARGAKEAFLTSASNVIMPVIDIDGTKIGDGQPGKVALELRRLFHTRPNVAS